MTNIAVFASGTGTNAEAIMEYFAHGAGKDKGIRVALLLSNNPAAGALRRASRFGVPTLVFDRGELRDPGGKVARELRRKGIDFVALAGFLWLVPGYLIDRYRNKMVNIHPALLPKYGGKGMYGRYVHEAVAANGDTVSGITIHRVTEEYDSGAVIFQAEVEVVPGVDTPDSIARKIHGLEYEFFPKIIERVILGG